MFGGAIRHEIHTSETHIYIYIYTYTYIYIYMYIYICYIIHCGIYPDKGRVYWQSKSSPREASTTCWLRRPKLLQTQECCLSSSRSPQSSN